MTYGWPTVHAPAPTPPVEQEPRDVYERHAAKCARLKHKLDEAKAAAEPYRAAVDEAETAYIAACDAMHRWVTEDHKRRTSPEEAK